jgi:alpha-D-ribose 1-methylphosphonate 5-triphosphate synthase subunit PhnI
MIIISSRRATDIETTVDELFGGGVKAHVARMLLLAPLSKERMDEIRSSVKATYKDLRGKGVVDSLIHEVKTILDQRLAKEKNNAQP